MRLFVALEVPAEVRERLATLVAELRRIDAAPKWVRAENLHVTLKFIGHVRAEALPAIEMALGGVRAASAIEVKFRGLGFFPHEKRPSVFWAGIEAGEALTRLAAEVDSACAAAGIPREEKRFKPHLTLARFKDAKLSANLRAAAEAHATDSFGELLAEEFHLMESKLKAPAAEYTRLQSYRFVARRTERA